MHWWTCSTIVTRCEKTCWTGWPKCERDSARRARQIASLEWRATLLNEDCEQGRRAISVERQTRAFARQGCAQSSCHHVAYHRCEQRAMAAASPNEPRFHFLALARATAALVVAAPRRGSSCPDQRASRRRNRGTRCVIARLRFDSRIEHTRCRARAYLDGS